jgi:5-methylcytosine-specific restriction endonuclease McrA
MQDCVFCDCGAFQYNAPRVETGRAVRTVKTVHDAIKPKTRRDVLLRASLACELCHSWTKELHVGHLVSVADGITHGLTDDEINSEANLCAMCAECNLGLGKETVPLRLAVAMVMARVRRHGGLKG